MAIHFGQGEEEDVLVDINTTPLIDVMLVLLIMLIITIPIQTHAVKLNMPAGVAPPPVPPAVVRIDVQSDGLVLWNGEALADEQALATRLAALAQLADQPEIHLRPDKRVQYAHVARVMAAVQRAGARKFGLIGNEQFAD